ncbi:hypothetical protein [Pseudomonas protegens]|uniref:hypothetical protein n=1 Tax=Pseudomonas protegens TaxID=380021 RepID=UPI000C99F701|nr:hypothetical protein [Pseudomonas protegens]PNG38431.1 hypothetical protein A1395_10055 [Pseudomonas protegens]ROL84690.1 hypothetical protein BK639_29615 [Pseudomonas protegens]ROM00585.1 hypothetical protein BK641_21200 [Pseudomonas protegens]ROM03780.1 hypothetical protein BK640_12125 [Pseudomonas protegens]ROM09760.1 hypothetical protein BK642_11065 [Pseudomonas protegens]
MFKTLLRAAALIATLALTGCVSYSVTGPLGAPLHPAPISSPRTAQIADVQVTAPGIDEATRTAISRSLTAQLTPYVKSAGYFRQLSEFPTRLGEEDVVLKFNMTSLKGHRAPHPGYLPGALLTLTVWIWVNGPIYVDSFDLAGELSIVDRNGKELASAKEQLKFERNVGLYGREYWAPTQGAKQLNELVAKLLDNASARLAQR